MRHPELHDFDDETLLSELRSRGVLKSQRQTKHIVGGHLEVWEKYASGWRVVDEVFVGKTFDAGGES